MKKIVITGVGGFIGSSLAKELIKDNVVYGLDIKKSDNILALEKNKNFIFVQAGFDDYKDLSSLIHEDIDLFYHFAWAGVFGDSFKNYSLQLNNVKAACDALMGAISIHAKKFIFAATNNEIDAKRFAYLDYFEPRFTNIYASCKLASELICKTLAYNYKIEYNAGMICMAYGEGNRSPMLANVLVRNLIDGKSPKLVEGNNFYDMIYIKDIVDAFIAIGEKGKNMKTYYVGHRKLIKFRDWVIKFRDVLNPNVELRFGEYKDGLDMDYSKVDLDALYNDTGFECRYPFEDGVKHTAKRIKDNFFL